MAVYARQVVTRQETLEPTTAKVKQEALDRLQVEQQELEQTDCYHNCTVR
ncbi:MAG: hypothetical protein HC866_02500 [Leptolyngbyaceae cyanobacterium RU_5_1]|nr:hypothetical protein [Leptolyngbyaceae cyanobacterium RU_5_1]